MEIKFIEKSPSRIKFEIKGEGHTLSNALRDELWVDKSVESAGYNIEHPLVSSPIFTLQTDSKESAKKSLFGAVERLKKRNKELIDKFSKSK